MSLLIKLNTISASQGYYQDNFFPFMNQMKVVNWEVEDSHDFLKVFESPDPQDVLNYLGRSHDDLDVLILVGLDEAKKHIGFYGKSRWLLYQGQATDRVKLLVPVNCSDFYQIQNIIQVKDRYEGQPLLIKTNLFNSLSSSSASVSPIFSRNPSLTASPSYESNKLLAF